MRVRKGSLVFLLVFSMLVCLLSFPVSAAAGDRVLLIQSELPWDSTINTDILEQLKNAGKFASYDVRNFTDARDAGFDLTVYKVVIIANVQSQSSYDQYNDTFKSKLETYASTGGVVIFGACDYPGSITINTALPGGVTNAGDNGGNYYFEYNNYIVDNDNPVVTGELSGNNEALTDADLDGSACSHEAFDEASLPAGTNVILRGSEYNLPTLIEYPLGNGHIIASGLTWEIAYVVNWQFAVKSYDDLFLYALLLGNASQEAPAGLLGIAPLAYGGTDGKITGTTAAMEYKLSADSVYIPAIETEITSLPAGTYDVRYAAKEGFDAGADAVVIVAAGPNASQAAPSGLLGIDPLTYGAADGRITGTTSAMEYKLSADSAYTTAPGTEITGLPAGTYDVRYAAKEGFDAGADVVVTIAAGPNASQIAPSVLLGIAPLTYGAADGRITGTTSAMEYKLSTDSTYKAVTGTEITGLAAGTYSVRYAAKAGFDAGANVVVTVPVGPNANQAAPAGLTVTSSAAGGSTGKITGTTPAMEYKLSTASTYKAVTGTEITGLAAGIYDVRYAAKEGFNAGAAATVIVSDVLAASIATPTPAVLSAAAPAVIAATGEHDNNMIMGLLLILTAGSTLSVIVWRVRKSDVR